MARNSVDRLEPQGLKVEDSRRVGVDALPEHTVYKDDGCGQGCYRSLECPFARCRFDDPELQQRIAREDRDRKILAARAAQGLTVDELARRFNVSRRTVHRILSRAKAGGAKGAA